MNEQVLKKKGIKAGYICVSITRQYYGISGAVIHVQEVCKALLKQGTGVFYVGGTLSRVGGFKRYEIQSDTILPFARIRLRLRSILSHLWRKLGQKEISASVIKQTISPADKSSDLTTISWSPITLWEEIRTRIDNRGCDRYFFHKACKFIKAERPDFLYERFNGCFSGVNLARRYNIPLILEVNGSSTFHRELEKKYSPVYVSMTRRMERKICERADAVVVVTKFIKQYLIGLGISEEKIFVIPNGADINSFFPDEHSRLRIRNQYNLDNKLVVGFVGSFRYFHGIHILIDSISRIVEKCADTHFLLVGNGPERENLELQVCKKGLSGVVTFVGNVPFQDVPAYINAMDVTVAPFPKLQNDEYSFMKIFEYMAVGKPIVASGYPDSNSFIKDHHSGMLVEPGNEYQLAQAILELLMDSNLRDKLGAEARRMVEDKYTWKENASKIIEIYHHLCR
ncbi:MAG: glycosyltransferase family 4 protein [Candidatus Scalindua sp.]